VQFRIGNGPTGAVVVDSANGSVHRLPAEITEDDFETTPRCRCPLRQVVSC
jgi:hypothetical protein